MIVLETLKSSGNTNIWSMDMASPRLCCLCDTFDMGISAYFWMCFHFVFQHIRQYLVHRICLCCPWLQHQLNQLCPQPLFCCCCFCCGRGNFSFFFGRYSALNAVAHTVLATQGYSGIGPASINSIHFNCSTCKLTTPPSTPDFRRT